MEMQRIINQEIQTVGKVQALTVSKGPKSGEENAFVQALNSPMIKICSDEQIKQVLRYVMIKVGLRAANWPAPEETMLLLDHIRAHYGTHYVEEIRVAFDMAIAGKLDLQKEDKVNVFDQFTSTYFSSIMNAYRRWSGEAYRQLITEPPKQKEMHPIDVRGLIEEAYQRTTGDDKLSYKLFPVYFYDQVVEDGYVHPELYREYMRYAKKELCGELQRQISPLIVSGNESDQPKADRLQRQLNEYRAGTRDYEIIVRAKQVSVWVLLQEARRQKMPALYVRVDAPATLPLSN